MERKIEYEVSKHSDEKVKVIRRNIEEKEETFTIQDLKNSIIVLEDLKIKIQAEADKRIQAIDKQIQDVQKNIKDSLDLGVVEEIKGAEIEVKNL